MANWHLGGTINLVANFGVNHPRMLQIALARMRGRPHLQNLLHVRVIVLYECSPQLQNALLIKMKKTSNLYVFNGQIPREWDAPNVFQRQNHFVAFHFPNFVGGEACDWMSNSSYSGAPLFPAVINVALPLGSTVMKPHSSWKWSLVECDQARALQKIKN